MVDEVLLHLLDDENPRDIRTLSCLFEEDEDEDEVKHKEDEAKSSSSVLTLFECAPQQSNYTVINRNKGIYLIHNAYNA